MAENKTIAKQINMAYTLLQLHDHVRFNQFNLGGRVQNLWSKDGIAAIPVDFLTALINEAALEIQLGLQADLELKHNSLTANVEVLAMPTNLLAVKQIVIFNDDNAAESTTALSAYGANEGEQLEQVSSYVGLSVGRAGHYTTGAFVGIPNVGDMVVGQLSGCGTSDSASNKPTKFMLHEQLGVLYALFDVKPDLNYFVDIYYWAIPATLSTDTDSPDIPSQYQSLFRSLAVAKVAEILGDGKRHVSAMATYERMLQKMTAMNAKRHTPSRVLFRLM